MRKEAQPAAMLKVPLSVRRTAAFGRMVAGRVGSTWSPVAARVRMLSRTSRARLAGWRLDRLASWTNPFLHGFITRGMSRFGLLERARPALDLYLSRPAIPMVSWLGVAAPQPERFEPEPFELSRSFGSPGAYTAAGAADSTRGGPVGLPIRAALPARMRPAPAPEGQAVLPRDVGVRPFAPHSVSSPQGALRHGQGAHLRTSLASQIARSHRLITRAPVRSSHVAAALKSGTNPSRPVVRAPSSRVHRSAGMASVRGGIAPPRLAAPSILRGRGLPRPVTPAGQVGSVAARTRPRQDHAAGKRILPRGQTGHPSTLAFLPLSASPTAAPDATPDGSPFRHRPQPDSADSPSLRGTEHLAEMGEIRGQSLEGAPGAALPFPEGLSRILAFVNGQVPRAAGSSGPVMENRSGGVKESGRGSEGLLRRRGELPVLGMTDRGFARSGGTGELREAKQVPPSVLPSAHRAFTRLEMASRYDRYSGGTAFKSAGGQVPRFPGITSWYVPVLSHTASHLPHGVPRNSPHGAAILDPREAGGIAPRLLKNVTQGGGGKPGQSALVSRAVAAPRVPGLHIVARAPRLTPGPAASRVTRSIGAARASGLDAPPPPRTPQKQTVAHRQGAIGPMAAVVARRYPALADRAPEHAVVRPVIRPFLAEIWAKSDGVTRAIRGPGPRRPDLRSGDGATFTPARAWESRPDPAVDGFLPLSIPSHGLWTQADVPDPVDAGWQSSAHGPAKPVTAWTIGPQPEAVRQRPTGPARSAPVRPVGTPRVMRSARGVATRPTQSPAPAASRSARSRSAIPDLRSRLSPALARLVTSRAQRGGHADPAVAPVFSSPLMAAGGGRTVGLPAQLSAHILGPPRRLPKIGESPKPTGASLPIARGPTRPQPFPDLVTGESAPATRPIGRRDRANVMLVDSLKPAHSLPAMAERLPMAPVGAARPTGAKSAGTTGETVARTPGISARAAAPALWMPTLPALSRARQKAIPVVQREASESPAPTGSKAHSAEAAKGDTGDAANQVQLLATEVWSILKRRLEIEGERRGRR